MPYRILYDKALPKTNEERMGFWDDLIGRNEPVVFDKTSKDEVLAAERYDSLVNALSGLGGENDLGASARPNLSVYSLNPAELDSLYRNNGYAQRIIDIFPDEATRRGWKVVDPSGEDPMEEEERRLSISSRFQRALKLARKNGGCLVVPIIDEPSRGSIQGPQLLREPLDLDRIIAIRGIHVFEATEYAAIEYGNDIRGERFREPTLWQVTTEGVSLSLHWSRAFYIPGVELSNRERRERGWIDDSVLQSSWDAIRNITSVDQGGASLAQRLALNVMKVSGLRNIETSKQSAFLRARMKIIAAGLSMLNMVVLGEMDEFDVRATPVSGFRDLSDQAKSALAAATGIPLAILFGEAPGGLNADGRSHREAFNNAVVAYQNEVLLEPLNQLYRLLYRAKKGPTRGVEPDGWYVKFLPLEELSDVQQAALELVHAQRDSVYMQWGVLDAEHVASSRFGADGYSNEIAAVEDGGDEFPGLGDAIQEILASSGYTTEE